MIYLVAFIVAIGVAYLVWKAFGPEAGPAPTRRGPIGPDDDADFLLDLDKLDRDREHHDRSDVPPSDPDDDPRPGATA